MMLIPLTVPEKLSLLNQVIKMVDKNGVACKDAFTNTLIKMKVSTANDMGSYSEAKLRVLIRWIFRDIKSYIFIKYFDIQSKDYFYWLYQLDKQRKSQRIKFLKYIREIYVKKYLEEIKSAKQKK
jgi:hypothetical protein